jgi:hypothetical protein
VRNNQHLLGDTVRGAGELIECSELFTIETTPRASETLPVLAHVIGAAKIDPAFSISGSLVGECRVAD